MPHSKKPSETLTKEVFFFFFFLIRRIFPVSNNSPSLPPSLHFRPACMPHHILQTWADRSAGRLEEVRRRWVGKVVAGCSWREEREVFLLGAGGACWALVMLADARQNVKIEVSRIGTITVPSQPGRFKWTPPCIRHHLSPPPSEFQREHRSLRAKS